MQTLPYFFGIACWNGAAAPRRLSADPIFRARPYIFNGGDQILSREKYRREVLYVLGVAALGPPQLLLKIGRAVTSRRRRGATQNLRLMGKQVGRTRMEAFGRRA